MSDDKKFFLVKTINLEGAPGVNGDYDHGEIKKALKGAHVYMNLNKRIHIYAFDCDPDKVSVCDWSGTVSHPKDATCIDGVFKLRDLFDESDIMEAAEMILRTCSRDEMNDRTLDEVGVLSEKLSDAKYEARVLFGFDAEWLIPVASLDRGYTFRVEPDGPTHRFLYFLDNGIACKGDVELEIEKHRYVQLVFEDK